MIFRDTKISFQIKRLPSHFGYRRGSPLPCSPSSVTIHKNYCERQSCGVCRLSQSPIADITAPDVLSMLRVVENHGALYTARRVMQVCGQVFMYAIATGRAERNPVPDLRGALKTPVAKHHAINGRDSAKRRGRRERKEAQRNFFLRATPRNSAFSTFCFHLCPSRVHPWLKSPLNSKARFNWRTLLISRRQNLYQPG